MLRVFICLAADNGEQDQRRNDDHHAPRCEFYEARKSFLLDFDVHFTVLVLVISHV